MKPFYFLRHGETDWNKDHLAIGQKDIPLNIIGVAQARRAAESLSQVDLAAIVTSPLMRALETARIVATKTSVPLLINENLKECGWGIREGEKKGDGEWLEKWKAGDLIEGAEPFSQFTKRVDQGMTEALTLPGPVLIVAHAGIYRIIQQDLHLPEEHIPHAVPIYHAPLTHRPGDWVVRQI